MRRRSSARTPDRRPALLREAGAVILGKANLTEFANIIAVDMPSGYSSLGGQVKNPYAPQLDAKGVPIVAPGGSSSGSAVAVAAGLVAAAIAPGLGLLLSPSTWERPGLPQAHRWADQPQADHPDRPQPGYRRSAGPHGARRRDPAQRKRKALDPPGRGDTRPAPEGTACAL